MTPLAALITGLTTGGLSCFAVQGGLLIGLLAQRDTGNDRELRRRWTVLLLPAAAFLGAKLVSHALLGLGLGWFGERLAISSTTQIWLQAIAAVFMVITGIRLLWPGFLPWLALPAPAPVRRFIRHRAKDQTWFAPAVLGFLTVFIPCGTTQAMEIAAVASANPIQAASIMSAFVIGTAPLFLVMGVLARGTGMLKRGLTTVAGLLVIGLGLYSWNGVLAFTGSPYEFSNVVRAVRIGLVGESDQNNATITDEATITVLANGYVPDQLTVPAGKQVTLTLESSGPLGCTLIFRIPKLNLEANLLEDPRPTLTAVFPEPGRYTFTCGMGMYSGVITAV